MHIFRSYLFRKVIGTHPQMRLWASCHPQYFEPNATPRLCAVEMGLPPRATCITKERLCTDGGRLTPFIFFLYFRSLPIYPKTSPHLTKWPASQISFSIHMPKLNLTTCHQPYYLSTQGRVRKDIPRRS